MLLNPKINFSFENVVVLVFCIHTQDKLLDKIETLSKNVVPGE